MAKTLVYHLYPRAWQGLKQMEEHLQRIAELQADYVWLSPIYPSPGYDHGYDVSDYQDIDPRFGSMQDFDSFVAKAHDLGMGVLMDLVLNHTSTLHPWFIHHPEYYCWSKTGLPGWRNAFDNGPAWQQYENTGEYYLHLFHSSQADLNWFDSEDELNLELAHQFRDIVDFWSQEHCVDGFRLDVPQSLNKDFNRDTLVLENMYYGDKALKVINAVFDGRDEEMFLIMECFDPTFGDITDYYVKNTPVNFAMNCLVKDEIEKGKVEFFRGLGREAQNTHSMLELESHDSARFPSRGMTPSDVLWCLFGSNTEAVCLYQGQELGLKNPTLNELPDSLLLSLDARSKMLFSGGMSMMEIREKYCRAYGRISLPLEEYQKQEHDPNSPLNQAKDYIARWRESEDEADD